MTRRRSWARITRTKSTLWVTVGTTKKSRATRSCTWFFKKVFHVGDDGLCGRTRYFSTVDLATSMPNLRSARFSKCSDARDWNNVTTKPSRAETTGGITGDLITIDGGRSTRALVQGEDVRGKSQES